MPFESALAKSANIRMFKHIRKGLDEANKDLGKERGEAPDAKGSGLRCSHIMEIPLLPLNLGGQTPIGKIQLVVPF